jgi:UDPglucose 6-dehydrogenase
MSIAVLLSQNNDVTVLDIDEQRVNNINNKISTVKDDDIDLFLSNNKLNLSATLIKKDAYENANYIIVATPTNYDDETNQFDITTVDGVVKDAIHHNPSAYIVIKSTIPVGYIRHLKRKHNTDRVFFSPEFLREGSALKDNLYPSRIIIGSKTDAAIEFANLLADSAIKDNIEILYMRSKEAEAVKLFANTYLAMRVSFFNELDSYSFANNIHTKSIIDGVCSDDRIGKHYNNPSFGYGGYCLPKDTKQLLANYEKVPQTLIQAIVTSNNVRKDFITDQIINLRPQIVGFYRLIMKEGSDNFRSSAVQDIINRVNEKGIETIIYEPTLSDKKFNNSKNINCLETFKTDADIIVANRMNEELDDVKSKVFTRDLFGIN